MVNHLMVRYTMVFYIAQFNGALYIMVHQVRGATAHGASAPLRDPAGSRFSGVSVGVRKRRVSARSAPSLAASSGLPRATRAELVASSRFVICAFGHNLLLH